MSWLMPHTNVRPDSRWYRRLSNQSATSSHGSIASSSTFEKTQIESTASYEADRAISEDGYATSSCSASQQDIEAVNSPSSDSTEWWRGSPHSASTHGWQRERDRLRVCARRCSRHACRILVGLLSLLTIGTLWAASRALPSVTAFSYPTAWYDASIAHTIPLGFPQVKEALGMAQSFSRPQTLLLHESLLQGDAKYLDAWLSQGKVLPGLNLSTSARIDGLWFWVNGSDPRHRAARDFYAQEPGRIGIGQIKDEDTDRRRSRRGFLGLQNTDNRFREHDELRYSLRSAKKALGPYLRTSHLITTDFWPSGSPGHQASVDAVPVASALSVVSMDGIGVTDVFPVEGGLTRYGQLPQWLNVRADGVAVGKAAREVATGSHRGRPPALRVHHDWSVSSPLLPLDPVSQAVTAVPSEAETLQRKLQILPTFNSLAAEASLGLDVPGLAETFFYSNDDMYLGMDMSPSDFFSPLYGLVFHIDKSFAISPSDQPAAAAGEMTSMQFSAWLLGQRFGMRQRHYVLHVQKVHSRPLLQETRMMWADEFAKTSSRRFRDQGLGANSHMLSYNFIIERHREALLWSYFVAKLDSNGDGQYSDGELRAAFTELGYEMPLRGGVKPIWRQRPAHVKFPRRDTLVKANVEAALQNASFPVPGASIYQFSSQDGYLLSGIRYDRIHNHQWPTFHSEPGTPAHDQSMAAILPWAKCWPISKGTDPVAMFQHMAFHDPDCGDYLISYLMGKQGRKGIEIFLPRPESRFPVVQTTVTQSDTTPHLPLHKRWQDCEFDLQSVARNTGWSDGSRRLFAMRLIQRYSYVVAGAPLEFIMLQTPAQAVLTFDMLKTKQTAFLGINDDVEEFHQDRTFSALHDFMEHQWPTRSSKLSYEL